MRKDQLFGVPIDGAKLMKLNFDLVSMLLVNVDGQSLVPIIKKRKAREGSAGVRPIEKTPMLKSDYKFSKEVSYNSLPMFLCLLTSVLFPFL